jgi:hypothetical protein
MYTHNSGGYTVTAAPTSAAHFRIDPKTWARDFLKRYQAHLRGKRRDQILSKLREEIARELLPSIFCRNCGDEIKRGEETQVEWASKRKCKTCAKIKYPKALNIRYCRHCGKVIEKASYVAMRRAQPYNCSLPLETSIERGWNTVVICTDCKDTMQIASDLVDEQLKILRNSL